jgi:low temperature requirement protein LtrA
MSEHRHPVLLRRDSRVSTIELFFDLVYVFAITQLARTLVDHLTVLGAVQTAVLLAMVWQVWVYTTWTSNYLDTSRDSFRVMLLLLMLASLVLSGGLTEAFGARGLLVASAYLAMQVGRGTFMIVALRGTPLRRTFLRIVPWTAATSVLVLVGATLDPGWRLGLWAAAIAIDHVSSAAGFPVPGLGRSTTREWTIDGSHFAERCQAFVLIALGEAVVVVGGRMAVVDAASAAQMAAFGVAFATSVGLWWVYFDRAAEDSARVIASSTDPGRLARDAFHWIHPLIVGGIIVASAADVVLVGGPTARGSATVGWLTLGGVALFLAGHAAFKAVVWRLVSWPRVVGAALCLALVPVAPHVSVLSLAVVALAVVVAVAVADRTVGRRAAAS